MRDHRTAADEPTHTLTVRVPLHLDPDATFNYDPVHDALAVVMSVSRLAADGVVCGDVMVSLDPA